MATNRRYTAWGLVIETELELPMVLPAPSAVPADVTIGRGVVPMVLPGASTTGATYQITRERCLISFDGVGRFLIESGSTITASHEAGAPADWVSSHLLGTLLAVLLIQRHRLVLHASTAVVNGSAILVAGGSGKGKSSVLAELLRRGHQMLSDDVTVVDLDAAGAVVALPGVPMIKLWEDSLARLGWTHSDRRRVRPELRKYVVPTADWFCPSPRPVSAVFVLDTSVSKPIEWSDLAPQDRFRAVTGQIRHRRLVTALALEGHSFAVTAALANRARVVNLVRPAKGAEVAAVVDAVESALG